MRRNLPAPRTRWRVLRWMLPALSGAQRARSTYRTRPEISFCMPLGSGQQSCGISTRATRASVPSRRTLLCCHTRERRQTWCHFPVSYVFVSRFRATTASACLFQHYTAVGCWLFGFLVHDPAAELEKRKKAAFSKQQTKRQKSRTEGGQSTQLQRQFKFEIMARRT